MLRLLGRLLVRLLYPEFCVHCSKFWTLLCPDCFEQLDFYQLPLQLPNTNSLASIHCAVRYGPVAHALVHAAKFESVHAAAQTIGKILFWYCRPPPVDLVIPVPLGKQRLGQRGFNQAEVIATVYARLRGVPVVNCLVRTRETKAQARQASKSERLQNMQQLFYLHPQTPPDMVRGKTVLLIDDVVSTGATLESCAQPLLLAGATTVHAQVFAHGQIESSRGIIELLHGDVLH